LNGVCLNILQNSASFGSDENEVEFITAQKDVHIPKADKLHVSFEIVKKCKRATRVNDE